MSTSKNNEEVLREALAEAIDYVEDAIKQWPTGSEEHRVAKLIHARCEAALSSPSTGGEVSRSQPLPPIENWLPIATAPTMGAFLAHDKNLEITRIVLPIDRDNYVTVDRLMLFNATHWQPLPAPPAVSPASQEDGK